ncbi:MAG: electron transport complex subunit RsxG [Pseudomonadota bacterium]
MRHPALHTGFVLSALALVCGLIISINHALTEARIQENERQVKLARLNQLVPALLYDNDFLQDTLSLTNKRGETITAYRARYSGAPIAVAFNVIVPDGYNGRIDLLVAIRVDGTLLGARVLGHRETPGLGDDIDQARSNWIYDFNGRSLTQPAPDAWRVKKDGGVFDQFTGATISPRAVVKGIKQSLLFFQDNKAQLFADA